MGGFCASFSWSFSNSCRPRRIFRICRLCPFIYLSCGHCSWKFSFVDRPANLAARPNAASWTFAWIRPSETPFVLVTGLGRINHWGWCIERTKRCEVLPSLLGPDRVWSPYFPHKGSQISRRCCFTFLHTTSPQHISTIADMFWHRSRTKSSRGFLDVIYPEVKINQCLLSAANPVNINEFWDKNQSLGSK